MLYNMGYESSWAGGSDEGGVDADIGIGCGAGGTSYVACPRAFLAPRNTTEVFTGFQ